MMSNLDIRTRATIRTVKIFHWAFVTLSLILQEPYCLAGGFMIPHQTARGLGLSNALTAGVNDPSAVYYNPAALGEVGGNNLLVNGSYINVINSVENDGRTARNQHDDHFLASLFANYHIPGSDFTLGIGTYTPFGLATSYENDFTRFAAERTELKTIFVTHGVSWHPSKYFSIGGGLSFVHASGLFSRSLCFDFVIDGCVTREGPLEGRMRLTDTTNAFTYNLGVLVKPSESLKLGFSYRARTDLKFDNADVKFGGLFSPAITNARVRPLPLPPVINAGVFWQIDPAWGAEFVYEYTRWSEFARFKAKFSPAPTFLPFAVPLTGFSLPENWRNTSTLRLGSFFKINRSWEIRGGATVEESPIPNKTLNPAIPGADLLTLNGGVGYKWQSFSVDLGYMAVFYKTRTVRNGELEGLPATHIPFLGAGFLSAAKDKYQTFNNFVSLSLGYHF
jgi:long-chain fatty acid transport protein